MFRKILRFSFIPTSFLFWFLYNGATVENESASGFSLFLLIFLLGIYALIVFNFSLKRFNLKVKARWFFYFFLASTTLILILETVPFFKNFVHALEFNSVFQLFAFLLLASWGISFILSLSFGIKTFFDKKLIRKVDLKKLTHRLRTTKSIAILSLLVVAGFLFSALTQNALFKDFLGIKTNQESVQSSSITPTSIPTPTPTAIIQEEKYIAPTNDPNPIVDCNFKYVGTKKIRSSECSKSFECQIGGQWYIYTSRDKCTQDQNKNTAQNPSFDWSTYRAARIKTLQGSLPLTNDLISRYENDLAKLALVISILAEDYQQGKISTEEYNQQLDKFEKHGDTITVELTSLRTERKKVTILIKRFEAGENVSPAEDKAILGY